MDTKLKFNFTKLKNKKQTQVDSLDPLLRADSLKAIELANAAAYYRQFKIKDSKQTEFHGRTVYISRCQFCHGVRGIGSTHAPSFSSTPLVELFSKSKLYRHVAFASPDARTMPVQDDFSKKESGALHRWIKAIEKNLLHDYQPGS